MIVTRISTVTLALLFGPLLSVSAQQENVSPPVQSSSLAVYPDSPDGLKKLIADILVVMRTGNDEEVSKYITNLVLRDHKTWFASLFGAEEGARLDERYAASIPEFPAVLRGKLHDALAWAGPEIRVEELLGPENLPQSSPGPAGLPPAKKEPVTLYTVVLTGHAGDPTSFVGCFLYVQGGFRYVDASIPDWLSTAAALRVRIRGNVQEAKIIKVVSPKYPQKAKHAGIEGIVHLHAIIGKDGSIRDLQVISGDPVLAKAALDAVKKWRYKPTLLEGKPVEVDSTIQINFILGR